MASSKEWLCFSVSHFTLATFWLGYKKRTFFSSQGKLSFYNEVTWEYFSCGWSNIYPRYLWWLPPLYFSESGWPTVLSAACKYKNKKINYCKKTKKDTTITRIPKHSQYTMLLVVYSQYTMLLVVYGQYTMLLVVYSQYTMLLVVYSQYTMLLVVFSLN